VIHCEMVLAEYIEGLTHCAEGEAG